MFGGVPAFRNGELSGLYEWLFGGLIVWVFWVSDVPISDVKLGTLFVCHLVLFLGAKD